MAHPVDNRAIALASWWCGRLDLVHYLESPSTRLDSTIQPLSRHTIRCHPDLRRFTQMLGIPPLYLLAYQAIAEGPYGIVRVAALFPADPFGGGHPQVFALDGDRRSLHRNPPWDDDHAGNSAHLCLYFPRDPDERRWTHEYGLIGLFDLARRHLASEDIWRRTGVWPTEDTPHGERVAPARPRPDLRVAPLRCADPGDA